MAATSRAWTSTRRHVDVAVAREDACAHDGERCRALLRRLLREVAAFARQLQQQQLRADHGDHGSATLWIRAVDRVCDARIERIQLAADDELPLGLGTIASASPHEVVAEAMVQELLVSLAAIRIAETEALVLDEVENVEALQRLRVSLQHEEAVLRRVILDGAGEDARLMDLQRMLREEFLQELAQTKADGIAGSLHHEASLQFGWETIQDQKKEIVRLRAENEQLKSTPLAPSRMNQPIEAIQQLQLQLSSHPDTRLRTLQAQVSQLEAAMTSPRPDPRLQSRHGTTTSGMTVDSSRDDIDDDMLRGSVLLPSHLAASDHSSRDCVQCRRQIRSLVECQSELKQLRAQALADDDSLVRAEKAHLHMKTEQSALTSALLAAKQKQEELRGMIMEITDEKLKLQSTLEMRQRKQSQQVESLQRQLEELEQWRETSGRERLDSLTCQNAMETELTRLKLNHHTVQTERDSLVEQNKSLERKLLDVSAERIVETTKAVEAMNAMTALDSELNAVRQRLNEALQQISQQESTIQRLSVVEQRARESESSAISQLRQLETQLVHEQAKSREALHISKVQSERISQSTSELIVQTTKASRLAEGFAKQEATSQRLEEEVNVLRSTHQRLEQLVAELEGRLNLSEEHRSELQRELDQAVSRLQSQEQQQRDSDRELQRLYEECQRLELSLADARAESASLQTQLEDSERASSYRLEATKGEQEKAVAMTNEQFVSLNQELSETKTTILMWMSKYHAVAKEKSNLEQQLAALRDEASSQTSQDNSTIDELRANFCAQSEDKEKVLNELERAAEQLRVLTNEKKTLVELLCQEEVKRFGLENHIQRISRELDAVATAKRSLEMLSGEQLVEIGVLQATNSILSKELANEKRLRMELRVQIDQDELEKCGRVEHQKRALVHQLAAFEASTRDSLVVASSRMDIVGLRLVQACTAMEALQRSRNSECGCTPSSLLILQNLSLNVDSSTATQLIDSGVQTLEILTSDVGVQSHSAAAATCGGSTHSTVSSAVTLALPVGRYESSHIDEVFPVHGSSAHVLHHLSGGVYQAQPTDTHEAGATRSIASDHHNGPRQRLSVASASLLSEEMSGDESSSSSSESSIADEEQFPCPPLAAAQHVTGAHTFIRSPTDAAENPDVNHARFAARITDWSVRAPVSPAAGHLVASLRSFQANWSSELQRVEEQVHRLSDRVAHVAHQAARAITIYKSATSFGKACTSIRAFNTNRVIYSKEPNRSLLPDIEAAAMEYFDVSSVSFSESNSDHHGLRRGRWWRPTRNEDTFRGREQSDSEMHAPAAFVRSADGSVLPSHQPEPAILATPVTLLHTSHRRRTKILPPTTTHAKVNSLRRASVAHPQSTTDPRIQLKSRCLRVVKKTKTLHVDIKLPCVSKASLATSSAQLQPPRLPSCSCSSRKAVRIWTRLVHQITTRRMRHQCMVSVLQYRDDSSAETRARQRFAALVVKIVAKSKSRAVLTVAFDRLLAMKLDATVLRGDIRERHMLAAWGRLTRKLVPPKNPLAPIVKKLVKDRRANRSRYHPVQLQAHAHVWHALRWRLECRLLQRSSRRLVVKWLAREQLHAREERLRVCFATWLAVARRRARSVSRSAQPLATKVDAHKVSSTLQATMHECVTLLRRCVNQNTVAAHRPERLAAAPSLQRAGSISDQGSDERVVAASFAELIRLLLEGGRQLGEWKEAMDKKLGEVQIREAQLKRLETHCAELQVIMENYHERRRPQVETPLFNPQPVESGSHVDLNRRWWLESGHPVRGAGQSTLIDPHLRALEKERRRLNQCSISMLERVIVQLEEAKETRVKLHRRLEIKSQALDRSERYYRAACIENILLRAFCQWRLQSKCTVVAAGSSSHTTQNHVAG